MEEAPREVQILRVLREIETADPDPAWHSDGVRRLVTSFEPDSSLWSLLIRRFGGSKSAAVREGLAWCLVKEGEKRHPSAKFEHVLDLIDHVSPSHKTLLILCLRALASWAMMHSGTSPFSTEAYRIRTFISKCLDYEGERAIDIRISSLSLLDQLRGKDLLDAVFDGGARDRLKVQLRGASRNLDAIFVEQVDEIIDALTY